MKVLNELIKKYKEESFKDVFYYDGELGAIYTKEKTTFKVWSPISKSIRLRVYKIGTPKSVDSFLGDDTILLEKEMVMNSKGVYETEILGDYEGNYYTYVVNNDIYLDEEIVDPYAKSAGVNGLRGMIVDFSKTNPMNWDEVKVHSYKPTSLTVYETHVSDLTSSFTWKGNEANRKKYLGVIEKGTTYKGVKTGFDHIVELGVNAVQLLPIFDQANDEINLEFNWGYNPLNYNVLEGGYSSNPYDGYVRIKEFKQLVQAFNKENINIIMDVVFNHVNEAGKSNFDILMPGYYFRYSKGELSNGSGCGNETASEMPMFRKFMIDSVLFYAKEYKLGGFRFDLMGLHDIDTMKELTVALKQYNEDIVVYGEPWDAGGSVLNVKIAAKQMNGNQFDGYGEFNDQFRDSLIKSGMFDVKEFGFVTSKKGSFGEKEINKIIDGIRGQIPLSKAEKTINRNLVVNYATCHDNYALFDRLKAAGVESDEEVEKMAMLANSMIFTSQGISFMLAGEEFLRNKKGEHNSYKSAYEVNEMDYELKVKHLKMFKNYQKLIKLKQNLDGLHLNETARLIDVEILDDKNTISYELYDSINNRFYKIIHTNGVIPGSKNSIDLTGYTLYLDTLNILNTNELGIINLKPFQTIIAYK